MTDDYLRLVGRRIKAARTLAGISQEEVSGLAPVSRVTLGSIERGEHAATLLVYLRLSRALGSRMGDLLDEPAGSPASTRAERTEGLPS